MEYVAIDASQFPIALREELRECLRARRINPKFHYETHEQAAKWLTLHEAYSPARTDSLCWQIYHDAFAAAAKLVTHSANIVGLGCGGGQKEAQLIGALGRKKMPASFLGCDVSLALVLTAQEAVKNACAAVTTKGLLCDLTRANDLAAAFDELLGVASARIITFFGVSPNTEPEIILPKLREWLRPRDLLLFSANLAPGPDYHAGVKSIYKGYDNSLTREWLMIFLLNLGVRSDDGELRFAIEDAPSGLKRIVADFFFARAKEIRFDEECFEFRAREKIRLFFSYRYTVPLVESQLKQHGIEVLDRWVTPSEEEGVFLCRRFLA